MFIYQLAYLKSVQIFSLLIVNSIQLIFKEKMLALEKTGQLKE